MKDLRSAPYFTFGMDMNRFTKYIRPYVNKEIDQARSAERAGNFAQGFFHLERAHVLGQASTKEHVRVHWHMLLWGANRRDARQVLGQIFRLIGAATKTAFGLIPSGNTGGTNVSPFKRLPIDAELAEIIAHAKEKASH
jgi:hypothetical protein